MNSNVINNKLKMKPIKKVANKIDKDLQLYFYGDYKAKIDNKELNSKSSLILVTAINPTKYGEGKTTVAIGLHDALWKTNRKSLLVLREPSLGPVFGVKGGATGGGYASIVPSDDINLHFNGDMHAITSANNLISAIIDNSIYYGNPLKIKEVWFKRCLDVNDRSLRDKFNITAASEIMAVFCLASDLDDLRNRLDNIIIGIDDKNEFVYVKNLKITGSLMVLLRDSFKPNLVQTLDNNPVLVHGGPFANIAHGCSSVVSLKTASFYAPYVITEAGFGSDAGAFKFTDIVLRNNKFNLTCVVLVVTIQALKYNGNGDIEKGIDNLGAHIKNLKKLHLNVVVTLNKFIDDTEDLIEFVRVYTNKFNVVFNVNEAYLKGANGCLELANEVVKFSSKPLRFLYDLSDSLENKIDIVAREICHAGTVCYNELARKKLKIFDEFKYPVIFAKTQYSFSDDAKKLGNPVGYVMNVTDIAINNGAKFIIVYLGNIITMPGLSQYPNALNINLVDDKIINV